MTADAVGGVATYARELTAALRERDVEVTLAVEGPAPERLSDACVVAGKLEWQDDPWDGVRLAGERLLELAEEVRPDVVHLNSYSHGALRWPAPVMVVGHSCVLSWWEAVRGEAAPRELDRYRSAVRAGLAGADAVVAPTAWMLGELRRLYGVEGGRVIHNGLSGRASAAPPKQPLVLGAGRLWDEAKGLDTLDAAASRIAWPVEMAGEAGARGSRHARLLGRLTPDELRTRVDRAAIFAHPARYEPFGLAPLEAAQAGCALVLGDLPSLREVWGDAAAYVPPGDGEALAHTLDRLIADPIERRELATRAHARAKRYAAATMADAYLSEYARIRTRELA